MFKYSILRFINKLLLRKSSNSDLVMVELNNKEQWNYFLIGLPIKKTQNNYTMKKNITNTILTIVTILFFSSTGSAQAFQKLDEAPHDITYFRESRVTPPLVKVIYGRPQKNGEAVFGNIVAFGKLWKTGANEATEVKFYQDIVFGDVKVPAGTYVLYTIPDESEWEVILSANLDVLGAYQYDPVFDVARIRVKSSKAEELETFSIAFKQKKENVQMVLGWDTTRVKIPINLNSNEEYAENSKLPNPLLKKI